MEIRETQIEDILVNAPVLTKKILGLEDEPRLIGRQKSKEEISKNKNEFSLSDSVQKAI